MQHDIEDTRSGRTETNLFYELTEGAPALLWLSDDSGRCLHLNKRLREFWGIASSSLENFDWGETIHPDDAQPVFNQIQAALAAQTGFVVEARYRHAEGGYRLLRTEASPRFSNDGQFIGMIGVNTDITDTVATLDALKDREERLYIATRAAGLGIFEWDILADSASLQNARMMEIFGHTSQETVLSKNDFMRSYIHSDDAASFDASLCLALASQQPFHTRCRIKRRSDGAKRWIEIAGNVIADEGNRPIKLIGVVADVTEQELAAEHARVLLGEVTHRSKNLLAVTQSIIRQTARGGDVPTFVNTLLARLHGLSASLDLLIANNWRSADLESLILAQFSHLGDLAGGRINVTGPSLRIRPAAAQSLGMAIHELATNASKYGALSGSDGCVDVSWSLVSNRQLEMTWTETGGPSVSPPQRQGFGQFVIKRMLEQAIEARISIAFCSSGVTWHLDAPAANVVEDLPGPQFAEWRRLR